MSLPVPPFFTDGPLQVGRKRGVLDDMLTAIENLGGAGGGVLVTPSLSSGWQNITGSPAFGVLQYSVFGSLVVLQGAVEVNTAISPGSQDTGSQISSVPTGPSGAAPDVRLIFESFGMRFDIHPSGSITYESWNGFQDFLSLSAVYRKGGS